MILCKNFAVNAVAAHYISIAKSEGIDLSVKLAIPAINGQVHDSDLCIIIGNFLENAIEACRLTASGERFIELKTSIKSEYLIIVMDNSFDGTYKLEGDTYFSQLKNMAAPRNLNQRATYFCPPLWLELKM